MRRVPDIQSFTHVDQLRCLSKTDLAQGELTPEEIDHIFRLCGALWLHDGNPHHPHAELTSGKCSNGFVNVLAVLRYTNLAEILADQLASMFFRWQSHHCPNLTPSWVVGSDHAAATLSYALAVRMHSQHDFTEKGPDKTRPDGTKEKTQIWARFRIGPNEAILQAEELVTTTGTMQAVREALRQAHGYPLKFFPAVLTLVHRSEATEFEGSPILYLRHYDIKVWKPEECPLCAQGSKRLRPKQNWAELTAA